MDMIRNSIVILLLIGGLFFFLVGTIGLYRLPDVFTRLHANTKSDTLGAGLIILSIIIYLGFDIIVLKLFTKIPLNSCSNIRLFVIVI